MPRLPQIKSLGFAQSYFDLTVRFGCAFAPAGDTNFPCSLRAGVRTTRCVCAFGDATGATGRTPAPFARAIGETKAVEVKTAAIAKNFLIYPPLELSDWALTQLVRQPQIPKGLKSRPRCARKSAFFYSSRGQLAARVWFQDTANVLNESRSDERHGDRCGRAREKEWLQTRGRFRRPQSVGTG